MQKNMQKVSVNKMSLEEAQEVLDTFTNSIQTVMLATVNEKAEPFSSYSPYVEDEEGNYYVLLSAIVPHAHNMATTKKAHIMFIEDESASDNMYKRRRLYFDADVEKLEENDEKIMELFFDKFGSTAKHISKMADFRLYKLMPKNGNITLGFGAAFKIDENRKIVEQNTGKEKLTSGHPHGTLHEKNI